MSKIFFYFSLLIPFSTHAQRDFNLLEYKMDEYLESKDAPSKQPIDYRLQEFLNEKKSQNQVSNNYPLRNLLSITEKNRGIWTKSFALAIPAGVLLQGILSWDWGKDRRKFGVASEGWFNPDSYAGGADKAGHMMSHYIQKRFYTWLFYNLGHSKKNAQLYGLASASLTGLLIEVGDGMTRFRFSWEDIIMDAIGITLAYVLDEYPKLDELFGLRWEYWPSKHWFDNKNPDKVDFMSDYNGQKFFFSIKARGIPHLADKWYSRYLTLDLGFYTRGYKPDFNRDIIKKNNNSQWWSYGIGLNLGSLIDDISSNDGLLKTLGSLTKYWVPPGFIIGGKNNITKGKYDYN
jgi:hypothetical protein